MKNLLFLAHRIPYPPNKGDKIRSYHFLKGLAENYNIYLATFIDDPEDWKYVKQVELITKKSFFVTLKPVLAKIKSLTGLFQNKALTLPYYQSAKFQSWIDQTIEENKIKKIFIFSSAMAQYVEKYQHLEVIVDFVDVDSDKWLQYSQKAKWPMNWVYQREAKNLLEFDSKIAGFAKMNLFVSKEEAKLFGQLINKQLDTISFVNNGVDTEHFNPENSFQTPFNSSENIIVFTGAMDYWANVDAVCWFVAEVFPLLKQQCSSTQFYIVGSKPTKTVMQLAATDGVIVTGRVEDVRPYIKFANVIVAPLLIARGIQNKVLEGMAMAKKIVASPQAMEGINKSGEKIYITENAKEFSTFVYNCLNETLENQNALENRSFVENDFSWDASLKRLNQMISN